MRETVGVGMWGQRNEAAGYGPSGSEEGRDVWLAEGRWSRAARAQRSRGGGRGTVEMWGWVIEEDEMEGRRAYVPPASRNGASDG